MNVHRILVACVGNIFLGDDGFGVEVARALAGRPLPPDVQIVDVGIRGIHLVYELLDGCGLLVLVDAAPHGKEPGTVSVIEVGPETTPPVYHPVVDAHGLGPDSVFALLDQWNARPARAIVVACEPQDIGPGMELTEPVRAAVPHAVHTVEEILRREAAGQLKEWSQ